MFSIWTRQSSSATREHCIRDPKLDADKTQYSERQNRRCVDKVTVFTGGDLDESVETCLGYIEDPFEVDDEQRLRIIFETWKENRPLIGCPCSF